MTFVSGAVGRVYSGLRLLVGGAAMGGAFAPGTIAVSNLTTIIGSFFGPIGIIGGLITGGVITGFVNCFRKNSKYKDALAQTRNKI